MVKILLLVASGGTLGALARYLVFRWLGFSMSGFPIATFTANILGCFLIGVVWASLASEKYFLIRMFLVTGFLGGFTSFSSFGWESFEMFQAGKWKMALIYIGSSNIIGLAMLVLGYLMIEKLLIR